VRLRDGSELPASAVVSAVPRHVLARILSDPAPVRDSFLAPARDPGSTPILSVHLWLDRPILSTPFLGLLDSPIHWVFDAGGEPEAGAARWRVVLVVSAARDLVERPAREILDIALEEIRRYLPAARGAKLVHSRVLKERRATFSARAGVAGLRPGQATPLPNLFLSGDWTDTGLPGTLEGAALSGHRCAELLGARLEGAACGENALKGTT
jgi:predicted NAD/FAD-dependent oxidoreductase